MPDHMLTAVQQLTTQVRRIADALTTPDRRPVEEQPTTPDDGPRLAHWLSVPKTSQPLTEADALLHASPNSIRHRAGLPPHPDDEEQLRTARRYSLGILLSRTDQALTADEEALLRRHVEAEMREADTWRRTAELADAVTAEMKRRTGTLRQRAEQAADTIERVSARVLAYERRLVGGWQPDETTRSAVAREFRTALDDTEQPGTGTD